MPATWVPCSETAGSKARWSGTGASAPAKLRATMTRPLVKRRCPRGKPAGGRRPAEARYGALTSMPSSITPTLTPWPAVPRVGAPERNGADETRDRVVGRVVGRDRIDVRDAGHPGDARDRAHREAQRERVEHHAVAALDCGSGHGAAQPRSEDVLHSPHPGQVEARSERRRVDAGRAAHAHQPAAARRDERERRRGEAHDDAYAPGARGGLDRRGQRRGRSAQRRREHSPSTRAPGAPGHVERTRSAAIWAASVGLVPTRMPRASSASFLAWAVPDDPEMIAPA